MQTSTVVAPKCSSGVGSTLTALGGYTPAVSAIITSIMVANTTTNTVNVSVTLYNGTTDYYLAKLYTLNPNDTLTIGGASAKLSLVNGWYVRVFSSAGTSVDATMCVVELS